MKPPRMSDVLALNHTVIRSDTHHIKALSMQNNDSPHVVIYARFNAYFGGIYGYISDVASVLLQANYRVSAVISRRDTSTGSPERLNKCCIPIVEIPFEKCPKTHATNLDSAFQDLRPDIIHWNDNSRVARRGARYVTYLRQIIGRRIVTLHADIFQMSPSFHKSMLDYLPVTLRGRRVFESAKFVNCFDHVISVSELYGDKIRELMSLNPFIRSRQIISIANGVDVQRFSPALASQDESKEKRLIVATSAGLWKYKRLDILIDAARIVANQTPISVRIAGDGEESLRLRQQAEQLGLKDTIEFVGIIANMPRFLSTVDVYVMCSDATETSSYSQLEAMAMGLPSVCSSVGDLPLRVRDGIEGLLVPPGDIKSLASKLLILANDDQLRSQMGVLARERVCRDYSRDDYLRRTTQVFDDALLQQSSRKTQVLQH